MYGHLDALFCFEIFHQRLKIQDDRPVTRGVDQSTDHDALINVNKERTVRSHNTLLSILRVTSGGVASAAEALPRIVTAGGAVVRDPMVSTAGIRVRVRKAVRKG